MMSVRGTRQLLWLTTASCLLASAAVLAFALLRPVSISERTAGDRASESKATTRPVGPPPLSSFAAAWSRNLRQSLDDVPAAAMPAVAHVAPSGLSVRLVGTIVDAARPRGIFMTPLGQMELRAVGEKAGGAEILRIDEKSATLSVAGRPVTLKVEKNDFAPPLPTPSARSGEKGVIP